MTSTTTVKLPGPLKPPGWCEKNGIEHAWESGPTLTTDPPILTRICKNCGKSQHLPPVEWQDSP